MKRLLIVLLIFVGIATWHAYALSLDGEGLDGQCCGEERNNPAESLGNSSKEPAKSNINEAVGQENLNETFEPESKKRYCTGLQEEELLNLLKQLEQPFSSIKKMHGGLSEVRWKYRIIKQLRKYDDCRAEDALRQLSRENICEENGEGDILCTKWVADPALQEVKATADLKNLVPTTPLEDQLKIINKYTRQPYKNNFAAHKIANYLVGQSSLKPEIFVPLLVELFPYNPQTEAIARRHPFQANKGLEKIFKSYHYSRVWWGLKLARYLEKPEFLEMAHRLAFEKKGNIDYTNKVEVQEIQNAAIGYFRAFEPDSVPYYRTVLYSDYMEGKEFLISGIKLIDNPEIIDLLKEYATYLDKRAENGERALREQLREKIALMNEIAK